MAKEKGKKSADKSSEDVNAGDSLEAESTSIQTFSDANALESEDHSSEVKADAKLSEPSKESRIRQWLSSINPYLLLFIIIVVIGIVVIIVANQVNREDARVTLELSGQELDQAAIDELVAAESNIGTVDQTLTVAANAIFEGKILVKDNLDVAGSINVGGPLSLPGITVAGESSFEDVAVSNNLSILGSASIQQGLTVQGAANIGGSLSVGGTISAAAISADSVEFTGDLQLTRHIDTGGGTPAIARGTAVGSGGTVSISGNDVSGTVTINTGGSPPAGEFARITFRNAYNSTPNVQLTPANSNSAGINYYVTRTSSRFTVNSAGVPSASTTYVFDYWISE